MQDYHQEKWSWILDLAGIESFGLDDEAVTEAIFAPRPAQPSAARRALEILHDRQRRIQRQARRVGVSQGALNELLQRCLEAAEQGVDLQDRIYRGRQTSGLESLTAHEPEAGDRGVGPELMAEREHRALEELNIRRLASDLGGREQWRAYFGEHARTFHLAARLFPPREAGLVAGLYAYCRFTDDLVDDPDTAEKLKPYYQMFCKRPTFNDEYLPTFNRPNVTLVDTNGQGVDRITENGLVVDVVCCVPK